MRNIEERLLRAAFEALERRRRDCASGAAQGTGDTSARLIEAGRRVFSARGAGVTVRDICTEAGANVAAVNYHFGSKSGLLAEVLRTLLDELLETFPLDGGVPKGAPVESRLYGFVFAFLCRVMLPGGCERECLLGRLLSEAFVRPMPSFEPYALRHRTDVRDFLVPLLAEIAGKRDVPGADSPDEGVPDEDAPAHDGLFMMMRSIVAQILFYNTNRDAIMAQRDGAPFTPEEIAGVARHITRFSLGGIRHCSELNS